MKKKRSSKRARKAPKTILRLPDLHHAKAAVLSSLACPDAQRGFRHAIDEFLDWYCSEQVARSVRFSHSAALNLMNIPLRVGTHTSTPALRIHFSKGASAVVGGHVR
jgi:hypothetical protein